MSTTRVVVEASESTEKSLREWLIAVGTIGAAFAAVYVGALRERWRRPKLNLEYEAPPAASDAVAPIATHAVVVRSQRGFVAAYVRLSVRVKKRKSAADDVEVLVVSCRETATREDHEPVDPIPIDGLLLVWANTPGITRATISPGTPRYLDLLRVDKTDTSEGDAPVMILVEPSPVDGRHKVRSASFQLELAVSARNADARRYRVIVNYDGRWGNDDNEIWQHLNVHLLES
jgi:hypothetical protein